MLRLKLARLPAAPRESAPAELCWDAPPASAAVLLSRREFLKALALLLAAAASPFTRASRAYAAARGRFLTRHEFATLQALCDRIIPPDQDPGARALGSAVYIERMLTAFDRRARVPLIFAGGPFSNRNPFPDNDTGQPSRKRPKNAFKRFIPLTRVQELRWRAELFGSGAVPGADFNDAALGPLTGLRDIYQAGLARVDEVARMMAGAPFVRLTEAKQDEVLAMLDRPAVLRRDPRRGVTFLDLVIQHTLEGCFAVPEYGGNHRRGGWKMIGLEGDDQPLGYSIFSRQKNDYNERTDHPMTTPNPDEFPGGVLTPRPISADADAVQNLIVSVTRALETC